MTGTTSSAKKTNKSSDETVDSIKFNPIWIVIAFRVVMITLTIGASLGLVAANIVFCVFKDRTIDDFWMGERLVLFYMLAVLSILSAVVIAFLELEIPPVMKWIRFAWFYAGRAPLQLFVGVAQLALCVDTNAELWVQIVREVSGYAMIVVGVIHLILGVFCIDRTFLKLEYYSPKKGSKV